MKSREATIETPDGTPLDAVSLVPDGARAGLVLAHGAGAGLHHAFMAALADVLARNRVATLRFQFPYMQEGRRLPDRPPRLVAAIRAAVTSAPALLGELPLFAGGKSLGGRMTSTAQAEAPLEGVRGLVFFGFPLHPAGKEGIERAAHLARVEAPMLFLQGTRDKLADEELIRGVVSGLGARATLTVIDGADHGFHVLKRSGRDDREVLEQIGAAAADWMAVTG